MIGHIWRSGNDTNAMAGLMLLLNVMVVASGRTWMDGRLDVQGYALVRKCCLLRSSHGLLLFFDRF